jgi:hypothetical protein
MGGGLDGPLPDLPQEWIAPAEPALETPDHWFSPHFIGEWTAGLRMMDFMSTRSG